jgi:hypothetical protein
MSDGLTWGDAVRREWRGDGPTGEGWVMVTNKATGIFVKPLPPPVSEEKPAAEGEQAQEGVPDEGEVAKSAAKARENSARLNAMHEDPRERHVQRAEALARATAVWGDEQ